MADYELHKPILEIEEIKSLWENFYLVAEFFTLNIQVFMPGYSPKKKDTDPPVGFTHYPLHEANFPWRQVSLRQCYQANGPGGQQ